MHDPFRPPLDIDCLATAIQVVTAGIEPACSLDPAEDERVQKSVILGISRSTRWADVMIQADYTMKKIAQGLLHPRSVRSYVDRRAILGTSQFRGAPPETSETNRWWFTRSAKDTAPRSSIIARAGDGRSADVVILSRNPVVLLTEKQVKGEYGTGIVSREAEEFAGDFTAKMEQIGREFSTVGELLALYRLLDVFLHLKVVGGVSPPLEDFWLNEYQQASDGPPEFFPTLSRRGSMRRGGVIYQVKVRGGVRMPLSLDRAQVRDESALATSFMPRILSGQPDRVGLAVQ